MQIEIGSAGGIPTVFAHLPSSQSATVEVFVKAGSVYETKEINGLAHFQEHMFFKGGKKYKTPQQVAKAVDGFGGIFNAFTGEEYVGYYITCAHDYISQAIDVLADMMVDATFPVKELEEEKRVILQELRMGLDNEQRVANIKWIRRYYGNNSYGRSTIGPKKNIEQGFTRKQLFSYKEELYTKDNMVIVVAGQIPDQEKVAQQIGRLFADLPEHKQRVKPIFPHHRPRKHEKSLKRGSQTNHVVMGANGYSIYDTRKYAARLLSTILGGNMSSKLFQEIREKRSLCYYIHANHFESEEEGVFKIRAGVEKNRWESGKKAIYQLLAQVADGDISQHELDLALGYMTGVTAMGIDTSSQLAAFAGPQMLFLGHVQTLDDILAQYHEVTLRDLKTVARRLTADNLYTYRVE